MKLVQWLLIGLVGVGLGCSKKQVRATDPEQQVEKPVGVALGDKFPDEGPKSEKVMSFTDSIYFEFDSGALKEGTETAKIVKMVDFLKTQNVSRVIFYGHCDVRGTREYNYALARRRVNSVAIYLNQLAGLPHLEFQLFALGEDQPKCSENTKTCHQQNRRVDVAVVFH